MMNSRYATLWNGRVTILNVLSDSHRSFWQAKDKMAGPSFHWQSESRRWQQVRISECWLMPRLADVLMSFYLRVVVYLCQRKTEWAHSRDINRGPNDVALLVELQWYNGGQKTKTIFHNVLFCSSRHSLRTSQSANFISGARCLDKKYRRTKALYQIEGQSYSLSSQSLTIYRPQYTSVIQ